MGERWCVRVLLGFAGWTALTGLLACSPAQSASASVPAVPAAPAVSQAPPPAPQAVLPQRFALHQIAPATFVLHEATPWASNVVLAQMPDASLVLVNAPATEASTRELLGFIHARFGQVPLTVINSHHHVDSVGGNALLREHGAQVFASTQTATLIQTDTPTQVASLAHDQTLPASARAEFERTRLMGPTRTFEATAGLTLRFGGEEVRIVYPGPAHSVDNLSVFFPARGVLFGSCMVRSGDSLGPVEHADLEHWPAAIRTLQALAPKVVVPGHGVRFDAAQLADTLTLLQAQPERQLETSR